MIGHGPIQPVNGTCHTPPTGKTAEIEFKSVVTRCVFTSQCGQECTGNQGSTPDHAVGAYNGPSDPLAGQGVGVGMGKGVREG